MLEDFRYSTDSWTAAARQKFAELNDLDPASMQPRATAQLTPGNPEKFKSSGPEATVAHLTKFYESVRSRKEPVENGVMGNHCATVGHMVNLSYKHRKEVRWDAKKQRVVI
ncbi:MAG: hypothetical protein ACREEM_10595 [Blastocatellia bacterium]